MGSLPHLRSRSAPRIVTVVVLAAVSACNTTAPPKDASPERVDASGAKAAAVEPAPTSVEEGQDLDASVGLPAQAGGCTADDDCRTWSSYCREAPCGCRALSKADPAPGCAGGAAPAVRCLVDPCQRKTAACQGGRCVLVVAPSR